MKLLYIWRCLGGSTYLLVHKFGELQPAIFSLSRSSGSLYFLVPDNTPEKFEASLRSAGVTVERRLDLR